MFARNAEPIANVPVYKRIALGSEPRPSDLSASIPSTWEICDALMRKHEGERIWALIKQTAEGTNAPTSSPSSTGSPTDCDNTVCTDGWEAA